MVVDCAWYEPHKIMLEVCYFVELKILRLVSRTVQFSLLPESMILLGNRGKYNLKTTPKSRHRSNLSICIPKWDHRKEQLLHRTQFTRIDLSPHSDMQPVISPSFFFPRSVFSVRLYPSHHRKCAGGKG